MHDELDLLCTHGILHLLGYDHADPDEHATMFGLQDRLLASWRDASTAGGPDERRAQDDRVNADGLAAGGGASADAAGRLVRQRGGRAESGLPRRGQGTRAAAARDRVDPAGRAGRRAAYLSVLLLARIAAALRHRPGDVALLHWLGHGWRAYLITAAVMTVVLYLVAGVVPRSLGRRSGAGGRPRRVLAPVVRVLGPLPRLLQNLGSGGRAAAPATARPGPRRTCAGWWTCWSSAT